MHVVEPAASAVFGLAGDPFHAEPEAPNDGERSVVVGRGGDMNPMNTHSLKGEFEHPRTGLSHQSLADDVVAEPVAEVSAAMESNEIFEADDPQKTTETASRSVALTNGEARRSTGIPVGGACVGVAERRFLVGRERHPGQPRLQRLPRGLDRREGVAGIGRLEGRERKPPGEQGAKPELTPRRDREHGENQGLGTLAELRALQALRLWVGRAGRFG